MSRTIRLNSTAGGPGSSSGSAGLTSAEVKKIIEQNSEWVLDSQVSHSSILNYPLTVIPSVDFDNVQAYRVVLKNFGGSSQGYCYLNIQNGSNEISGTSTWSWQMYRNSAAPYDSGNTSFSGGQLQLSVGQSDSIEGSNWREITIWINKSGSPNNGSRVINVRHENGIPANGGYQTYRKVVDHHVIASAVFNSFGIGFTGNSPSSPSTQYGDSNIYVYKKLRAPAS